MSQNDSMVEAIYRLNFDHPSIDEKEQAMLEFAVKETISPDEMTEQDVQKLRQAGFEDEDILDISMVGAYANFINRVSLSLGVEKSTQIDV